MEPTHEHVRIRPRVSRACERCRIKKAKCDGERPCHRCNLDSALCSYKSRRKPEPASASQRYTDFLLQHQSALTAGLLALYSRMLEGQPWDGAPVEEVDGNPSVHCILERLGVIEENEDEVEQVSMTSSNIEGLSVLPPTGKEARTMKPERITEKVPRKLSQTLDEESPSRSSNSTPTRTAYRPSDRALKPAPLIAPPALPADAGSLLSSFGDSESQSTPITSPWTSSSGCGDEMFPSQADTPASSSCSTQSPGLQASTEAAVQLQCSGLGPDGLFHDQLQMPYVPTDIGQELYNTGYFMDAAGGMMSFDCNDGNVTMGYAAMPFEYSVL